MSKYVRFGSLVSVIAALTVIASACYGATITGTVKGPDGSPAKSVFVQAQNTKTKITTYVMSDAQGRYKIEKLVAGDYRVQARATGLRSDPKSGVALTADQNASVDFALETTPVRWSDISIYQAKELLPAATGKDTLLANCFVCHGFQSRMAAVRRDADGWKDRVEYMRNIVHFSLANSGKFGDA